MLEVIDKNYDQEANKRQQITKGDQVENCLPAAAWRKSEKNRREYQSGSYFHYGVLPRNTLIAISAPSAQEQKAPDRDQVVPAQSLSAMRTIRTAQGILSENYTFFSPGTVLGQKNRLPFFQAIDNGIQKTAEA